jgi:hypothetical protein
MMEPGTRIMQAGTGLAKRKEIEKRRRKVLIRLDAEGLRLMVMRSATTLLN